MNALIALGLVTALAAAIRGNWSPCGESLQAQLHPLGEQSRGNRWSITIAAFTLGSSLAGALIAGSFGVIGSMFVDQLPGRLTLTAGALTALVAGLLDLSPVKPWTPKRQVNENWIGRYRGWVYGLGFGLQLGVGFAVFVMSWCYYAMLAVALLSGSWLGGALIGVTFGIGRGILLYTSRWITTPERLAIFHRRATAIRESVFKATGAITVAVAIAVIL